MRNPRILVIDREPELAGQVKALADELRPRPEVTICDRLGTAEEQVVSDGPFDVIVAGPSLATRAGLNRLQGIHDDAPAASLVLVFPDRTDVSMREVVRTGALDMLPSPVADRQLLATLERAVSVSRPVAAAAAPVFAPPKKPESLATVYTVASATGGCGKTFYATNLAYFLHHHTGKPTCVIDLDLQFGEVSTALRLRPRVTIADALARDDIDEIDLADHLEDYMLPHTTGFKVLPAPRDPSEADRIHPTDVTRVIEAARRRFEYVIVDTPGALTEAVLAAFDLSDRLYVMATLDLPSVRNMSVFLNTLEKLKIPSDNINLILNKAERDVGIELSDITSLFSQGFSSVLPYAREVSKSVNLGMPILASSPNSEVASRLAAGLAPLLPETTRARVAVPQVSATPARRRPGFFARLFRPILHPLGY